MARRPCGAASWSAATRSASSLDDVLRAFLLQDPKLEAWLVAQAEAFAELTDKTKTARLRKLDAEIAKAQAEAREAAKLVALAEVEARFATTAGEAA